MHCPCAYAVDVKEDDIKWHFILVFSMAVLSEEALEWIGASQEHAGFFWNGYWSKVQLQYIQNRLHHIIITFPLSPK